MKGGLHQLLPVKRATWPVIASICVIFLAVALPIKAQQVFIDTFDYYHAGNLNGQGKWILYDVMGATLSGQVVGTNWYSAPYSAKFTTWAGGSGSERPFNPTASGSLSFNFYFSGYNGAGSDYIAFYLNVATDTSGTILGTLHCEQAPPDCDTGEAWLTGIPKETWNYLRIDFNAPNQYRVTINASTTDWLTTEDSWTTLSSFAVWNGGFGSGTFNFYIDNIGGSVINYCGENASCGFCNSSTTCVNAGCYWLNDTCFWFPVYEISDFNLYYASNSSFATPTAFVLNWVSFTGPFVETLGNWTSAFQDKFNLASATERGLVLGQSIPEARGYLEMVDNFFLGLPVSEAFITILTILLLVIIFRVIKAIVGFLKP
jgi:hypothetical protein